MRCFIPFLLVFALLAPAATAATETAIELGDQVTGTITAGDVSILPFRGLAGTLVKLTLKADQGSFPDFSILKPRPGGRTPLDLLAYKKIDTKKGKSVSVKKLPLPATGVYYLVLTSVKTTEFSLKTSGKLLKKITVSTLIPLTAPDVRIFGTMPGTLLSVSAKGGKGSGLDPEVRDLRTHALGVPFDHDDLPPLYDPDGTTVDLTGAKEKVKFGLHSFSKIPMPEFGDGSIRIATRDGSPGGPATIKVSMKHPKPRKAKIELADIEIPPQIDLVVPNQAFDNNGGPGITRTTLVVSGAFFRTDARLRLVNGLGETIEPDSQVRLGHTVLRGEFDFRDVPESVERGDFDLVVEQRLSDPSADETATLEDGFHLDRAPVATGISPTVVWDGDLYGEVPCTITGKYFAGDVTLTFLRSVPGGEPNPAGTIVVTPTTLMFPLNSWTSTAGTYTITVTNGDGGTTELPVTLEVRIGPSATSIDADSVFDNDTLTGVALTGDNLVDTPAITFVHQVDGDVIEATNEAFVSATGMTFDVSGVGAKLGTYDLFVTNPDGGRDVVRAAFVVKRAPVVTGVLPVRAFAGETIDPFDITGDFFENGTTVEMFQGVDMLLPDTILFQSSQLLRSTLDLTGANHGPWGVTVTNPSDGGSAQLADVLHVLGTFGLVEDETGATTPLLARDDGGDEYLAVYVLEHSSGDTDIRAQRISIETGLVVAEIKVTETVGKKETEPLLLYDPDGDRYIVVYLTDGRSLMLAEIAADGTSVDTTLTLATTSGSFAHPAMAYNPDDGEFMILVEKGGDILAVRAPTSGGLSESSVEEFNVLYESERPSIAWSSTEDAYVIVFQQDIDESLAEPPPPDSGMDLFLIQLPGNSDTLDFNTNNTVANTTDDEVRPKLVWNTADDELLIVYEREISGSNTDVYAIRYDASNNGSFPAAATRVEDESTATVDATSPMAIWEDDAEVFLFVYVTGGNGVVRTELSGTLGSATHTTVVAGSVGDTRSAPSIAAREQDGEVLVLFGMDATSEPDRQIEGRFSR